MIKLSNENRPIFELGIRNFCGCFANVQTQ